MRLLSLPKRRLPAGLGKRNLLILLIKSNLRTGYRVKGSGMRSRDRRTKRDAAFRRGGFMPRKPLRKHPHSWEEWGCGRTSIIRVNFCCPLSWFRFYSPAQTLGSVQINIVSFHSKCKVLGKHSDTVQHFKGPCRRSFPWNFLGPHREGAPPYAEKIRFRRAGIKKAHAVILC